jgi:tetratricopeptide (TPR) repeat protein
VRYLALAGERAQAAAAFEEALRLYENALSLQPAEDKGVWADLMFKRGSARLSLGRWEEALADWREALAAYEELGDADAVGRVSSDVTQRLLWGARYVEALEISRRGLMALGDQLSADRCRLLGSAGVTLSLAGSYAAADAMIAQAMVLTEELGDQRLLEPALSGKCVHHWAYMQMPEAIDAGMRGSELLRSSGDLWGLANTLAFPQYALVLLGRLQEAAEIGEELEPLGTRLGHLGALVLAGRSRGVGELMLTADLDRFEQFAKDDLELCRRSGVYAVSNSYTWLGLAHFWRGRWQEALENHQEAARLELPGFFAAADWAYLFLLRAYLGEKDTALAMLDKKRGNFPSPGQANSIGAWTMLLGVVEGLAVLDEQDNAAKLYPLVLEAMDTGVLIRSPGDRLLQTVAGIAAACGKQWEKTEEHYQTALRQAHQLPHKIEQPEVRRWYARMLIDRDAPGDRDKAFRLLTEAIAMYHQIGMPKHVEMAEAMLGEV